MIFSKFFKPKYQHPDPQIRLQAIESLLPSEPEHKTHLHELAFNDADPKVNLAALTRLNSFPLWSKMADTSKTQWIKKKSQQVVEDALFERGGFKLSEQEKVTFITECSNNALLEKLLSITWVQNNQSGILLQILAKLDKPHVTKQAFVNAKIEAVQQDLLAQIEDTNTLNKCLKKTTFSSVKESITYKLEAMEADKLRPFEIEKHTRMLLSQMLALKDKTDFPILEKSYSELKQNYQVQASQFDCLKLDVQDNLKQRFEEISFKVQRVIDNLAPEWERKNLEQEQLKKLTEVTLEIKKLIQDVSILLAGKVEDITLGEVEKLETLLQQEEENLTRLKNLNASFAKSAANKIEPLFNQIFQTRSTLERLPEFQQAIKVANEFLDKFEELALPTDYSQMEASFAYLKEQGQQWQAITTPYASNWPSNLESKWHTLRANWKSALNGLKAEIKQNEQRCKNKLVTVDTLIKQGKYKAAMGMFSRVDAWYQALPEKSQKFVNRTYEDVKVQVENLKDWQQYIALPRKPALLDEATLLAQTPLDIENQSAAVKRIRSEWNSLGNTQTEADTALNKAFDEAIEKAFEPCRVHFAEQDKLRAGNYHSKLELIAQISALDNAEVEDVTCAEQLLALQKQWREIGHVDYKKRDEINSRYAEAIKPIQLRVDGYHQANAEAKLSLVKQVESLLDSDNVLEAVEMAKSLQKKWQMTGSAGNKQDNKLWRQFRQANDTLFNKRNTEKQQQKESVNAQISDIQSACESLKSSIQKASEFSQLKQIENDLHAISARVDALEIKNNKKLHDNVRALHEAIKKRSSSLRQQQKADEMNRVFDFMRMTVDMEKTPGSSEQLDALPNQYRQSFLSSQTPRHNRLQLNVMLDILNDEQSNAAESEMRQTLQLEMMSDKLQNGIESSQKDILNQWIQHGKVDKSELYLLERIASHFVVQPSES